MAYGHLNAAQRACLALFVRGEAVLDLGCGTGELSFELMQLGAASVDMVDVELPLRGPRGRMDFEQVAFRDLPARMDAWPECWPRFGFLSWPVNWPACGLVQTLERLDTVVYLGSNLNGSACGDSEVHLHLLGRPVRAVVEDFRNTLIVYGRPQRGLQREPCCLEERGWLTPEIIGWPAWKSDL